MASKDPDDQVVTFKKGPPIFIVSGGTGATCDLLARTVLAQFPNADVPIQTENHVFTAERVREVVKMAADVPDAIVLHTMVNDECRHLLEAETKAAGVAAFDLCSPLLEHLTRVLGVTPLGKPGLFRQMHRAYFERIEAIEYSVAHDDGKRIGELAKAEIVLVGVSRVGKTPLSIYLSMLGWKVANVPFVPEVPPPAELWEIDRTRIVGLMIEPAQLIIHRKSRQVRSGIPVGAYVNRDLVIEELRAANHFFYQHSIPVVETTDKPIETCAEEVVAIVSRRATDRTHVPTAELG